MANETMRAAVVTTFGKPPAYRQFEAPPVVPGELRISVRAAALSNLVRGQAAGRHYSSGTTPMIPGVDGVGVLDDGTRVFFAFPEAPFGTMAETVSVGPLLCVRLPNGIDDLSAAASANPGMSSMIALQHRAHFEHGESVLINGATGVSGKLAISVAKALGARHVIATGRDPQALAELPALGADIVIPLEGTPDEMTDRFRHEIHAHGIAVVLDYLWGAPASQIIAAIAGHGGRHTQPRIRFVNIGSMAGTSIDVPAATLRSSGLELLGSGLGSVSHEDIVTSIGAFFKIFVDSHFSLSSRAVPLEDVESTWTQAPGNERIVFTIGS